MDTTQRYWFITSTTYGTWLPGDARGFVSNYPEEDVGWVKHNQLDTPYDRNMPDFQAECRSRLQGEPVYLIRSQADAVLDQFQETCHFRNWKLYAAAVMSNHFHALLAALYSVPSTNILRDLKAYASRRLNREWPSPASGTWWTESGSRRPIYDERGFLEVYRYIVEQPNVLASWAEQLDPMG